MVRSQRLLSFLVALLPLAQAASPRQSGDSSKNTQPQRLPSDAILVKGAWSSASDRVTAIPEGGTVANNFYTNPYFGLTYALTPGWIEKYSGPPPSDSGYYVLAQIRPQDPSKGGSILIAAQDLFFTLTPATNALELIGFTRDTLQADYKVERPPAVVTIADRPFVRFDYYSPAAGLHWNILATQIRCHMIEFVFMNSDPHQLESLIKDMNKTKLPAEASPILGTGGNDAPVCVKDYARGDNVLERVDPVFGERRFNAIPVRIVVDKQGQVKHIHFLSAFPDQAKSIADALRQWRFKPYLRNGRPAELETGIVFGQALRATMPPGD